MNIPRQAIFQTAKLGFKLLNTAPISQRKDESHLYVVFAKRDNQQHLHPYATWLYNDDAPLLTSGDYCKTFTEGFESFQRRKFKK